MSNENNHAKDQAKAQLESIVSMVKALEEAREADEFAIYEGEEVTSDDMSDKIQNDALSLRVRSDWHNIGESTDGGEFELLLCTGGPAVRIIGTLNESNNPEDAKLEYQDWGTPWTEYPTTSEEQDALIGYAEQFYFGE